MDQNGSYLCRCTNVGLPVSSLSATLPHPSLHSTWPFKGIPFLYKYHLRGFTKNEHCICEVDGLDEVHKILEQTTLTLRMRSHIPRLFPSP